MNTEHKSHTKKEIKDLYETPFELFNTLNKEFNFTIDVAASEYNRLTDLYYSKLDNALFRSWGCTNVCWCNPPYSDITPWVKKAKEESEQGSIVVMLVPADTSVQWFKEAWNSASEMRFISGRISFINAETGKPVKGNNKGSVLIIWLPGPRFISAPNVTLINRDDLI